MDRLELNDWKFLSNWERSKSVIKNFMEIEGGGGGGGDSVLVENSIYYSHF